jgi:hypothetical protein
MEANVGTGVLKRDRRDWEHFRPSRANTRGVVSYIPPELHAALVAWADEHGVSLVELSSGAIVQWAKAHGLVLEDGTKGGADRA